MPRPRLHLKPSDYGELTDERAQGGNLGTAADRVGMTRQAFEAALKSDERARRAWQLGKDRREKWLVEQLHAAGRQYVPTLFELKARHRYIDQPQPAREESRIRVELVLPKALDHDRWRKLVDVSPRRELKEASG